MNKAKPCTRIRRKPFDGFKMKRRQEKAEMVRNLIFDIDGTLWDARAEIAASWNEIFRKHRETADLLLTAEDMKSLMGRTMAEIAFAVMPDVPKNQSLEIMNSCTEHENEYLDKHSGRFYDGVADTILRLSDEGYGLYIVSNCQDGYIQCVTRHGGFTRLIRDTDCFGRTGKMKGETMKLLMERNALSPLETCYVGDTAMDQQAASLAGVHFVYASYGFGDADHPEAALRAFRDLPETVKSL